MFPSAASQLLCLSAANDSFWYPHCWALASAAVQGLEQPRGSAMAVAEQPESEGLSSKLPQHASYEWLSFSSCVASTYSGLESSSEVSGKWSGQCAPAGMTHDSAPV